MHRRYYPRQDTWEVFTMAVTNSHSPYCRVLELLYTDIFGMKWSSFRSLQHFELHHKQCPTGGTFLGY